MKIEIDQEKCISCGSCEARCPEVFVVKCGKAEAKVKETNKRCAKEAARYCPAGAIKIT